MLDTVFAAKMCDYGKFRMRVLREKTKSDLDRLETVCARLFSLLPEDNERTTILQNAKISQKNSSEMSEGLPHLWHKQPGVQPFGFLFLHFTVRTH